MSKRKITVEEATLHPASKKTKDKSGEVFVCVKCSKNVEEDSIECESCLKWEHRVCAGISKEEYEVLSGDLSTNIMFFCSICRPKVNLALKFFNDIEEKQKSLGEKVKQLEEKLQSFVTKISQSSNHSSTLDFSSIDSQNNANSDLQPKTVTASLKTQKSPPKLSPSFLDKKFNIIVYGIEESSQGTKKYLRTQNDLNNLLAAFSNLKPQWIPMPSKIFSDWGNTSLITLNLDLCL